MNDVDIEQQNDIFLIFNHYYIQNIKHSTLIKIAYIRSLLITS